MVFPLFIFFRTKYFKYIDKTSEEIFGKIDF